MEYLKDQFSGQSFSLFLHISNFECHLCESTTVCWWYAALCYVHKLTATASIHNRIIPLCPWFAMNSFTLNPDKTEVIQMSRIRRAKKLSLVAQINVAGSTVRLSVQLKLVEVTLDAALGFNGQIKSVCKESFFHMRALRHIRLSSTDEMANCGLLSLFQTHLDYANLLYTGILSAKLQQTTTNEKKSSHALHYQKREHFTYPQAASLASDSPTRRIQVLCSHKNYGSLVSLSTLGHCCQTISTWNLHSAKKWISSYHGLN